MKLSEIIALADGYVPNEFTPQQKADWLTSINHYFFETVKIPKVFTFQALRNVSDYTLPAGVAMRNIDRVTVGSAKYESIQLTDLPPGMNGWAFDEATNKLTLTPAPAYDTSAYVRYAQKGSVTFSETALHLSPESPDAYHHLYAFGLAEIMGLAMDDITRATNYGQQYRDQLTVAQSNYSRAG